MTKERKYSLSKLYYWMVDYRSRRNYWTCSKFAEYLRDKFEVDTKPKAATTEEWDDWKDANKEKFGYWLTEEGLDYLQDVWMFIPDVYNRIRIYLTNRYVDKTHYIDTKLKPGDWHEFDTRLLHGMFEALVKFVEDEKTSMSRWLDDDEEEVKLPDVIRGINYLRWEMSLIEDEAYGENASGGPTHQAKAARETLALYWWWKHIRPLRQDSGEASGLYAFFDSQQAKGISIFGSRKKRSEEDEEEYRRLRDLDTQIETDQHNEDTDMMTRLIKLRNALWT